MMGSYNAENVNWDFLEHTYPGYFKNLPELVNNENQYPHNTLVRVVGEWRGTGVIVNNTHSVLTACHLFMNLENGKLFKTQPLLYPKVNSPSLHSPHNAKSYPARKIMIYDGFLGLSRIQLKQRRDFKTLLKNYDIAMIYTYESLGDPLSVGKLFDPKSAKAELLSQKSKQIIGYLSPSKVFGYKLNATETKPWHMRQTPITHKSFLIGELLQDGMKYKNIAMAFAFAEDLKIDSKSYSFLVTGPGLSGSPVWIKEPETSPNSPPQWKIGAIYIASTSPEAIHEILSKNTNDPLRAIVCIPCESFLKKSQEYTASLN